MYKIAIIDDSPQDILLLTEYLFHYCNENNISFSIDTYDSSVNFDYSTIYDVIFIDPNIQNINGLQLARKINMLYTPKIIIISTNPQYMHLSFDIKAFHFINKQYINDEIKHILDISFEKPLKINDLSINKQDILYIIIEDHLCTIKTINNEIHAWKSLKSILKELDSNKFVQINKSTVINIEHIIQTNSNTIILSNHQTFKLSDHYKNKSYSKLK